MSEPFKVYVNKTAFASNGKEIYASLYIEKPIFDSEGKVVIVREEQGLLVLGMEYAENFAKILIQTIQKAQNQQQSEGEKEVEGNESK
jgi:hypothetical protein